PFGTLLYFQFQGLFHFFIIHIGKSVIGIFALSSCGGGTVSSSITLAVHGLADFLKHLVQRFHFPVDGLYILSLVSLFQLFNLTFGFGFFICWDFIPIFIEQLFSLENGGISHI